MKQALAGVKSGFDEAYMLAGIEESAESILVWMEEKHEDVVECRSKEYADGFGYVVDFVRNYISDFHEGKPELPFLEVHFKHGLFYELSEIMDLIENA